MTVGTYLTAKASAAVLSADEKGSIAVSISTLANRLSAHFGITVSEQFLFGSYTRDTILPRSMDAKSDIDYMVVFSEVGLSPQTYLTRLKTFAEKYYHSSEISQSHPTIVLSLNHIRFELVPALPVILFGGYSIPDKDGNWQTTNPNDFNAALSSRNKLCSYYLKPAARLVKAWNANRGYPFESYGLEKWMAGEWYNGCYDLKDHLFYAITNQSLFWAEPQWKHEVLARAKHIIANTKLYLASNLDGKAETEVAKLFV